MKPYTNNIETVQFTMRMDKSIYEKLKERAKINKRSITKELEHITETTINNQN
ncbi:MAG: Arc family DNA-binding protein [Muribaculaceae bacterium]|nr:Arc family DNA-binding protein [Muribaculaceae bacterium]